MAGDAPPLRSSLATPARGPLRRRQVDRLIARVVACFGVFFAAQTVPILGVQLSEVHVAWAVVFLPVFCAALVVALVASIVDRVVAQSQAVVAIVYLAGIVTWPLAITEVATGTHSTYWLYPLLTIASAMAAIAFSARVALAYLVVMPVLVAIVRVWSGAVIAREAALDSAFFVILGAAILVIITMLRRAASRVDAAQETALSAYSTAVRQHATEAERVQVDAIVHDSVLTTLLSAARADTPETRALAATMAAKAIVHLRDAAQVGPHSGATTPLSAVTRTIVGAAADVGAHFEVRTQAIGSRAIPAAAAEAVCAAASQAMVNSVQHAGGAPAVKRWVTVRSVHPHGLEVEVGDTGAGFTVQHIPPERIGVRVSILERVAASGGRADVDSAHGEGTVITIRWPAESRWPAETR